MEDKKDSVETKPAEENEGLTRRAAIKRIASVFAASYVGAKVLSQVPPETVAYLSNAPYNPYSDSVYGSYNSHGYYSITYYTSYSSHYSSVPSP